MPNRLAQAQSLYLRKHANNPIDWWTWGDAALEKARQENKPIFLSIGYSSCHWCTVMEGEAFSDQTIADYLNAHYVAIKVDREERPDIDSIYMQALQLMTGQGGWPLNVFLAPTDLLPFYGGTYFPVDPKYGRLGFFQVLQSLRHFYDQEGEKVTSVKTEILERLQQSAILPVGEPPSDQLLQTGLDYSAGILSAEGTGSTFPMMPYAAAALRGGRFQWADARYDAATISRQRGVDLALGGIYDQVGGGFHRYTVDSNWTVPHFEKMLYDNGQIVEFLADLWASGMQESAFERAIQGTVQWLKREMAAPAGYFYAAQDADSFATPTEVEPEEGAFYVWRYTELEQLLTPAELAELAAAFFVTPTGNFEGKIVLQRRSTNWTPELEPILAKLFTARYGTAPDATPLFPPAPDNQAAKTMPWSGRIPAVTDTKMIVAWNSLMISGLARSATVFQRLDWYESAATAAQFIVQHQFVAGRFHRLNYDGQPSIMAQAEDYALFVKALLDLDQAALALTQTADWLTDAVRLQAEFDDLWSVELGGYYSTTARADLVIRERGYEDHAMPSSNGIAAANLVRLFLRTEQPDYLERAEQTLQAFGAMMQKLPQSCPSLFSALDWFQHLTLVRTNAEEIAPLAAHYFPTVVYRSEPHLPDGAIALVCQGLSCLEPADSDAQLHAQIRQSVTRSKSNRQDAGDGWAG